MLQYIFLWLIHKCFSTFPECVFTNVLVIYLLMFQAASFRGDVQFAKLRQLEKISSLLICRTEAHESVRKSEGELEGDDGTCCICYACDADTKFVPCSHNSCFGCISRHLLNCRRCFFCNATVTKIVRNDMKTA